MTTTPDLGIPYVAGQQSQPEVTHNDALNLIQMLLNGAVSLGLNVPPGAPVQGDVYVVGDAPTGAWAGRAKAVAGWFGTAWKFLPGVDDNGTPITIGIRNKGMMIFVRADNLLFIWDGFTWASTGVGPLVST